jgi:hypothetical protein
MPGPRPPTTLLDAIQKTMFAVWVEYPKTPWEK